jgi:two-component system phosphate regulon sensor histidine kinase PhoR
MASRRPQLVTMYLLSLAATMTLLVIWVVYVVRSASRLEALGRRVGVASSGGLNWILLSIGCAMLFFLIVGLTYQLAQALAARRYVQKQDEFISNITHEMKSPLAAIKLHAQTLQAGDLALGVRDASLRHIVQQADRMGRLVDNVLESSRLLEHRRTHALAPLDLAAFLSRYLGEVRPPVEPRGVRVRGEIAGPVTVMANQEALRQVLDNLIDNAVRFSEAGGEVRCRVAGDGAVARIEVEDDGAGIPKTELPHVFDRFYQAGRESDPHRRGTGLGLSIVAGLVEEMQGEVRAFSQEGRPGSRFVVELPAVGAAS